MHCMICHGKFHILPGHITLSNDFQSICPHYNFEVCEKCYWKVIQQITLMDPMNARINKEEQV